MGKAIIPISKRMLKLVIQLSAASNCEAPDDLEVVGVEYVGNQDIILLTVSSETLPPQSGDFGILDTPSWWWPKWQDKEVRQVERGGSKR